LEWLANRWSEGWLAAAGGGAIREVERREKALLRIKGSKVKREKKKIPQKVNRPK
jgi:hypothetical protein